MSKVDHRRGRKRCQMCGRKKLIAVHGKCLDCRWVLVTVRMASQKKK